MFALSSLMSFRLDVTNTPSRCTRKEALKPSSVEIMGMRYLIVDPSPTLTWRDAASRVFPLLGTLTTSSHCQSFDASRNGICKDVSPRSSTKTFKQVQVRWSPARSRTVGVS